MCRRRNSGRSWVLPDDGTLADASKCPPQIVTAPNHLSPEQAARSALAGLTPIACFFLFRAAKLLACEHVLVTGVAAAGRCFSLQFRHAGRLAFLVTAARAKKSRARSGSARAASSLQGRDWVDALKNCAIGL